MSAVFSAAQLRASLFAGTGMRVHAVVDGLVVPGLPEMLRAADTAGWDCLQRGALTASAAAQAAYIVELKEASPFTDWLIDVATPTWPGWGVMLVSSRPMLPVREHCRSLADVTTPDGERRRWRWYDPEVLRTLLPAMLHSQLDEFFALGQKVVIAADDAWTWLGVQEGVLASDTRKALKAAK